MRTIIQLQRTIGINCCPLKELSLTDIIQKKKYAIYAYHGFKIKAAHARTTFLDQRVEELALAGEVETSLVLKQLKYLENVQQMHRRIKRTLGTFYGAGVSQTVVTDSLTGTTHTYNNKVDVEREILNVWPPCFYVLITLLFDNLRSYRHSVTQAIHLLVMLLLRVISLVPVRLISIHAFFFNVFTDQHTLLMTVLKLCLHPRITHSGG